MAEQQSPPKEIDLAIAVSKQIEIDSIRMLSGSFSQNPKSFTGQAPVIEIEVSTRSTMDPAQKKILVLAIFGFTGRFTDDKDDTPGLKVSAEFQLYYSLNSEEGFGPSHYDAFARVNGVYNAWPYWREFVQSAIGRMGLPPLAIPVFRPTARAEQATQNKPPSEPKLS